MDHSIAGKETNLFRSFDLGRKMRFHLRAKIVNEYCIYLVRPAAERNTWISFFTGWVRGLMKFRSKYPKSDLSRGTR